MKVADRSNCCVPSDTRGRAACSGQHHTKHTDGFLSCAKTSESSAQAVDHGCSRTEITETTIHKHPPFIYSAQQRSPFDPPISSPPLRIFSVPAGHTIKASPADSKPRTHVALTLYSYPAATGQNDIFQKVYMLGPIQRCWVYRIQQSANQQHPRPKCPTNLCGKHTYVERQQTHLPPHPPHPLGYRVPTKT